MTAGDAPDRFICAAQSDIRLHRAHEAPGLQQSPSRRSAPHSERATIRLLDNCGPVVGYKSHSVFRGYCSSRQEVQRRRPARHAYRPPRFAHDSKEAPESVGLGTEIVAGSEALVDDAVLGLDGTRCDPRPQDGNAYAPRAIRRELAPDLLATRERELEILTSANASLKQRHREDLKERQTRYGDLQKKHAGLQSRHKELVHLEKKVRADLVRARPSPMRTLAKFITFHVLRIIAKASPSFVRRRTGRITRLAARLDPQKEMKPAHPDRPAPTQELGGQRPLEAVDSRKGMLSPSRSGVFNAAKPDLLGASLEPDDDMIYLATRQDVVSSGFWDQRWYLKHHLSEYVAWRAGQKTNVIPVDHYLQVGWRAG